MTDNLESMTQGQLLALAEQCGAEEGPDHCRSCEAWWLYIERQDAVETVRSDDEFRIIARDGGDFVFIDTKTNAVLLTTQSVSLETLNRLFKENS